MYRCILVPLDGSPFGEHALPFAASIARRSGAVLHLTHVHLPPIVPSGAETAVLPPAWFEMTRDEKRTYLDTLGARVAARYGIRVETRLMDGAVASALERHAMNCAAGLIVMSTHAHVGFSRLWHHGVADQLSRDLPLPILLVRPDTDEPPGEDEEAPSLTHILLPLEGSEDAEAMLPHAARLGTVFGARYTLLRVVQPESAFGQSLLGQQDGMLHHQRAQVDQVAARQYLNAVAERMRSSGLEVETEVVEAADVASAIIQRIGGGAQDPRRRIDLVGVASHPRNAMTRLLFRGTTDVLVKESPVPVLVFQQTPVPSPQLAGAIATAAHG